MINTQRTIQLTIWPLPSGELNSYVLNNIHHPKNKKNKLLSNLNFNYL